MYIYSILSDIVLHKGIRELYLMGKSQKKESKKNMKKSKKNKGEEKSLHRLISQGLLQYPELNTELSSLILAIDRGKEVIVDATSVDGPSRFLSELFESLPLVRKAGDRWALRDGSHSVGKHILTHLLKCGSIIQPTDLSPSQIISTRAIDTVLPLFVEFPTLKTEMILLLEKFLAGEGVSVRGISNETIKAGITSFFIALGSESLTDDPLEFCDEFACPSSASAGKHTRRAVEDILRVLNAAPSRSECFASDTHRDANGDAASSSSSCAEESESEGQEEEELPPPVSGAQGPAKPSRRQLEEAQRTMQQVSYICKLFVCLRA